MIEEVIGFYMGGDFKALAAIVAAREYYPDGRKDRLYYLSAFTPAATGFAGFRTR
jgi:hypothetical protein